LSEEKKALNEAFKTEINKDKDPIPLFLIDVILKDNKFT
jgi:hypothetical protein